MEKRRYKVCGYKIPGGENPSVLRWLAEKFDVEIVPPDRWKEAEFLLTDTFDYVYEQFDGIRILYTGENHPIDLRFFDYCVTHTLKESDRCIYFPYWMMRFLFDAEARQKLEQARPRVTAEELKAQGRKFCSFICRNAAAKRRVEVVKELMKYKTVSCGGPLMNNVGGRVEDKVAFQREHLFSMAYENEAASGYQTEKIIDAYLADSIPLYWGNPHVEEIFNPRTYVHERAFRNRSEMIQYILNLSENYEKMAEMLSGPVLVDPHVMENAEKKLYDFFARIFERGPKAIQRTRWQRINAFLSHFYGHGLFRTIRRISRSLRGKKAKK